MAAIGRAGSQAEIARICGVSTTAVWKWVQSSKRMPAEYVLRTEAATGVSRHDLRPDIYPRETMVDRRQAERFTGVDQRQRAMPDMDDAPHSPILSGGMARVDFNRTPVLKVASR